MLGSAVVILVLGGVCYVLVRRVLPRVAARPGREVRVLESAPLGRNALVHLLKVGEETYLVASSREAVCLLAKVASAESHSSAAPPAAANLSGKVGG